MQCAKCIYVHMGMSYIHECMSVSFETVCFFCCDSWNLKNYLMNTIRKIFRRTRTYTKVTQFQNSLRFIELEKTVYRMQYAKFVYTSHTFGGVYKLS